MLNGAMFSSVKQDWGTPKKEFSEWNEKYDFNFDPCCTLENCVTEYGIFEDLGQDGLIEPWRGRVFMNPPYNDLKKWIAKAFDEAQNNYEVEFVVGLIPARTDTQAFHEFIWRRSRGAPREGVTVDFIPGRLAFGSDDYWQQIWNSEFLIDDKGEKRKNRLYQKYGRKTNAPFPSMLIEWKFNL